MNKYCKEIGFFNVAVEALLVLFEAMCYNCGKYEDNVQSKR